MPETDESLLKPALANKAFDALALPVPKSPSIPPLSATPLATMRHCHNVTKIPFEPRFNVPTYLFQALAEFAPILPSITNPAPSLFNST